MLNLIREYHKTVRYKEGLNGDDWEGDWEVQQQSERRNSRFESSVGKKGKESGPKAVQLMPIVSSILSGAGASNEGEERERELEDGAERERAAQFHAEEQKIVNGQEAEAKGLPSTAMGMLETLCVSDRDRKKLQREELRERKSLIQTLKTKREKDREALRRIESELALLNETVRQLVASIREKQ